MGRCQHILKLGGLKLMPLSARLESDAGNEKPMVSAAIQKGALFISKGFSDRYYLDISFSN